MHYKNNNDDEDNHDENIKSYKTGYGLTGGWMDTQMDGHSLIIYPKAKPHH